MTDKYNIKNNLLLYDKVQHVLTTRTYLTNTNHSNKTQFSNIRKKRRVGGNSFP